MFITIFVHIDCQFVLKYLKFMVYYWVMLLFQILLLNQAIYFVLNNENSKSLNCSTSNTDTITCNYYFCNSKGIIEKEIELNLYTTVDSDHYSQLFASIRITIDHFHLFMFILRQP